MLSDALRLIRVFHDMKQQDLADQLDISKSYLSEIENGKKVPSVDVLEKYAALFSIPPSSIMFFAESVQDGRVKNADEKVRSAIADKVVRFLKFIESKTNDVENGLPTKR
jgi:transcriptional regulator with XRE-family HTH domain